MAGSTIEVRLLDLPEVQEKLRSFFYQVDDLERQTKILIQQKERAHEELIAEREKNRLWQDTINALSEVIIKLKKDALNDSLLVDFKHETLAPYQQDIVKLKDAVNQLISCLIKDGLSNA
jgi:hypothetical protein